MRGTLEYIRNRKTELKKKRKTAKKFGQNRIQTTLENKPEKPLLLTTKTENRMLKNEKSANHNEHQNRSLLAQKPKKCNF